MTEILASGMTQIEVAAVLGISQASVSAIFNGAVTDPKVSIADAVRALHAERCGAEKTARSEAPIAASNFLRKYKPCASAS